MSKKRTNKQHLEYILVPTGNQAVKATGNLVGASGYNIANGQIGAVAATHNSSTRAWGDFIQAADTASDVEAIKLVLGTSYSSSFGSAANAWGTKQYFLETPVIHKDRVRSFSARLAKVATRSAVAFTGLAATPQDTTLYKMYIEIRSRRNDRDYGNNVQTIPVTYTTPDYTALSGTIVDPDAHLIQHMMATVNEQSAVLSTSPSWMDRGNVPVIGFALDVSGGSGTALGTITCGTSIDVMTTVRNGVSYTASYVADEDFVATVQDWIANTGATVSSTIEVINTSNAGTSGTPAIDAFIIMGTDQEVAAAYDDILSVKTKVEVELAEGFTVDGFTKTVGSRAFDGYGDGRHWRIQYDTRAFGQRYNLQVTGHKDNFIDLPLDNLDETKVYSAHIIDFWDEETTLTTSEHTQKRAVILLEGECTCASPNEYAKTFDLSSTTDGDTYVFNGTTFEDDQNTDGVTGSNIAFNGTAAGLAAAIETAFPGVRATVDGTDVTVDRCNTNQVTTATNLDSILKVWLDSTSLNSKNIESEFGSNWFLPA